MCFRLFARFWFALSGSGECANHRCTGVHIFGDAKHFCPNLILLFSNNVQTACLNVRIKTYQCKQIKISACLIYQLPRFKAVRPQLAINILHNQMWSRVIFIGWKRLANYNKTTTCGNCCLGSSFSNIYIHSMLMISTRSS